MRHVQYPPREKYDRGGLRKQASDYQGLLERRENNDSGNKEEIGDMRNVVLLIIADPHELIEKYDSPQTGANE